MVIPCLLPPRDKDGQVNKKTMSFARLYTEEIEDFLKRNVHHCCMFFNPDVFNEEKLPLKVARLATNEDWAFEILDRLLIEHNIDLWALIHFPEAPETSSFKVFAERFLVPSDDFLVLDRVAEVLDVHPLLEYMCAGQRYPTLRAAASNEPQIQTKIARRFLRELPRLEGIGEEWFWSLIGACTCDAQNIYATLSYLLPDWKRKLTDYRSSISSSSYSFNSTQRVLVAGVSCRSPTQFEPYRDQKTVAGTSVMPELRDYQKELVERTNRGENTIICAPTGSGKTVVAAHIALHHLKSLAMQRKTARVVMIVPTLMLVKQQAEVFKQYAMKEYYVAQLSGDTKEIGEAQLLKFLSADIVVMMPQILVNMLRDASEKARLYIADITLLLLDECHHTDKKYPYNIIMQHVKDAKHQLPQVVGLTASLGVGDSGIIAEDTAINHIVGLCARTTTRSITTVMRNRKELARYVQLPEDVICQVLPMPLDKRHFYSHLLTAINFVERHLYAEFDTLRFEEPFGIDLNKLVHFPPVEKCEYINAVVTADTELRNLTDGERKWRMRRGIEFLKMYYNAMLLNDFLPASYAFEQLSSDVEQLDSTKSGRRCAFLEYFNRERQELQLSVASENDKDMLRELRKELINQFRVNANSRVLIFCQRREIAHLLAKYLNEMSIEGIGRADVLTSTNQASSKNGQSCSEQQAVIESFKMGTCKVIVATPVAEEGLDVPECNLIIKYNIAGNVISRVQQRGRARALNSRSVLLALDEKMYEKEFRNKSAEEIMMRAITTINEMGDVKFGEAIDEEKELQVKPEERKEIVKKNTNKYKLLSLLCDKCNEPICASTSLRIFPDNLHASIDPTVWQRFRLTKKGVTTNDAFNLDVVLCSCGQEIGRVVNYQGKFLVPIFKAERILFKTTSEKLLSKMKKWTDIKTNYLDIRDGTDLDATIIDQALHSSGATLSTAMDNLCLL